MFNLVGFNVLVFGVVTDRQSVPSDAKPFTYINVRSS